MISPQKLTDVFKSHLSERPVELQPEVCRPEQFPHIIPDHIDIDSSSPTDLEVQDAIKAMKNGKCKGTDNILSPLLLYPRTSIRTSGCHIIYDILIYI